jgi:hypothetical protein
VRNADVQVILTQLHPLFTRLWVAVHKGLKVVFPPLLEVWAGIS